MTVCNAGDCDHGRPGAYPGIVDPPGKQDEDCSGAGARCSRLDSTLPYTIERTARSTRSTRLHVRGRPVRR